MEATDYDFTTNGEMELVWAAMGVPRNGRPFTFFDVGCNHGTWTDIVVAQKQDVRGYLFDINPAMTDYCADHFAEQDGLTILNVGLSHETADDVKWQDFGNWDGLNTLLFNMDYWSDQVPRGDVKTVQTITGDSFVERHDIEHIDMLKIDCEGWDWNVLQGFAQTIADKRITVVQWEYGFTTADLHVVSKDFWQFFEDRGYIVGPLRKNGVAFQPFSYAFNQFDSGPNFVAALPSIFGGSQ